MLIANWGNSVDDVWSHVHIQAIIMEYLQIADLNLAINFQPSIS